MLLDVQLDGRPDQAATRARELVDAGAAGLFTFEGPHDVFLPLAAAAGVVEGLDRAGRSPESFAVYPQAILAMGRSPAGLEAADLGVRGLLAFNGSTPAYRPVLDVEGWGDLQPELNALSKVGDVGAMIDLVSPEMVETLAVRGTPEECAAQLTRRFGDLTDRVCCYFPGYDVSLDQVSALAGGLAGGM